MSRSVRVWWGGWSWLLVGLLALTPVLGAGRPMGVEARRAAAQEAAPRRDLAAMVLTAEEVEAVGLPAGFGSAASRTKTDAEYAGQLAGIRAISDADLAERTRVFEEQITEIGFVRFYQAGTRLPSEEGALAIPMSFVSWFIEYQDASGAEAGYALEIEDGEISKADPVAEALAIGDESAFGHRPAGDETVWRYAVVRVDDLVIGLDYFSSTGEDIEPNQFASLANRLLDRVEAVTEDGGPNLGDLAPRPVDRVGVPLLDTYSKLDGEDIPRQADTTETLEARAAGYRAATDVYDYSQRLEYGDPDDGDDNPFYSVRIVRFADEAEAEGWLADQIAGLNENDAISDVTLEPVQSAASDEAVAGHYLVTNDESDRFPNARAYVRQGGIVASLGLSGGGLPEASPAAAELLPLLAECLAAGACAGEAPTPPSLGGEPIAATGGDDSANEPAAAEESAADSDQTASDEPAAETTGSVPFFRGDPARTGEMPGPGPEGTPVELWRSAIGPEPAVITSPVVANGLVYVGASIGIFAFDAETGEERWRFGVSGLSSSPAVDDGAVYVGNVDGNLYALDADTGEERWRFADPDGGELGSSPVVVDDVVYFGYLIVGSSTGGVNAVDTETGELVWRAQTTGMVIASPAVADGLVVIGDFSGRLYAFDAVSGDTVWQQLLAEGLRLQSSPAVVDGTIYFGCCLMQAEIGFLVTYDLATGEAGWSFQTEADVFASPAVVDGTVYIGSIDRGFYALAADGSTVRWVNRAGAGIGSSAAVADGVVYIGVGDGTLFALDAESGEVQWSLRLGSQILSSAAVVDGAVYIVVGENLVAVGNEPMDDDAATTTDEEESDADDGPPTTADGGEQTAPDDGDDGGTSDPSSGDDDGGSDGQTAEPDDAAETGTEGDVAEVNCDDDDLTEDEVRYLHRYADHLDQISLSLHQALEGIYVDQSLAAMENQALLWQSKLEGAQRVTPPPCYADFHELYLETLTVMVEAGDTFLSGEAVDDVELGAEALQRLEQARATIEILYEMLDYTED